MSPPVASQPSTEVSGATQATSKTPNEPSVLELLPLSLGVDCGQRGREVKVPETELGQLFATPEAFAKLSRTAFDRLRVVVRPPKLGTSSRLMVALDHHPPRAVEGTTFAFASLHTEWDQIAPGTHRLVAFWLDEQGLPHVTEGGRVLTSVRWFHIEEPAKLPLAEWYLVSPTGTLNAPQASASPRLIGYPFGLSLMRLDAVPPREGAPVPEPAFRREETNPSPENSPEPRVLLRVSTSNAALSKQLGEGNCALSGFGSGDHQFELSLSEDERVARTLTVNLDLGQVKE